MAEQARELVYLGFALLLAGFVLELLARAATRRAQAALDEEEVEDA